MGEVGVMSVGQRRFCCPGLLLQHRDPGVELEAEVDQMALGPVVEAVVDMAMASILPGVCCLLGE